MNYTTALLLSVSANLDTFAVCISYGMKKVKLSFIGALLISLITSLGTFLSMYLGKIITNFISPKIVSKSLSYFNTNVRKYFSSSLLKIVITPILYK